MSTAPLIDLLARADAALQAGLWTDARALLEAALRRAPRHSAVLVALGQACLGEGDPAAALRVLRRAVVAAPALAAAHGTLALALAEQGQHAEARASAQRAVRLAPEDPRLWLGLGRAQLACGEAAAAGDAFEQATRVGPADPEAWFCLGVARQLAGDLAAAEQAWSQALARANEHLPSRLNRAVAVLARGAPDLALADFDRVLASAPDYARAHHGRGNALHALGRLDEACAAYQRAASLEPDDPELHYTLGDQLLQLGEVEAALASYRAALARAPTLREAAQNCLFTLNFSDRVDAASLSAEHRRLAPVVAGVPAAAPAGALGARGAPARAPGSVPRAKLPLRVGFVSADLRAHSVAWFLLPLLQSLDASRLQATCYSNNDREDTVTERLRAASADWRRIDAMSDEEVARQVRDDGIDLLVDLSGHSAGQRLGVFARRAAPLQASWLGYPNTTGLEAIDLRLVDAITDPGEAAQALATERLLRLEGCFLCYRAPDDAPAPRPRDEGAPPTFGSFNALPKITASTLDLWTAVLAAEPDARLLLKAGGLEQPGVQARLRAAFADRGIDPERLQFVARTAGIAEHLAVYHAVDVALDTYPYHGTTTTCEALWMGVPVVVVSRAGDRHASRVGASLLAAAGLSEYLASDTEGYVAAARRALGRMREEPDARRALRARVAASALTDAPGFADRFTRAIERACTEARASG